MDLVVPEDEFAEKSNYTIVVQTPEGDLMPVREVRWDHDEHGIILEVSYD